MSLANGQWNVPSTRDSRRPSRGHTRFACPDGLSNGLQESSRARRPSEKRTPDSRSRSRSIRTRAEAGLLRRQGPAGPCSSLLHREIKVRRLPSGIVRQADPLWLGIQQVPTKLPCGRQSPHQRWDSLLASAPFGLIRGLTCGPLRVQIHLVEIPAEYSRHQTDDPRPRDVPPSPREKRSGGPERRRLGDTHSASIPRRRRAPRSPVPGILCRCKPTGFHTPVLACRSTHTFPPASSRARVAASSSNCPDLSA